MAKGKWAVSLFFALFAGPFISFGASDNSVTMGGSSSYPPFHFIDAQGEYGGFDVELFQRIAVSNGLNTQFNFANWELIQENLATGAIDVVPMFMSAERQQRYLFSNPILIENHFVFGPEDGISHNSLESLAGFRVAAEQGAYVFQELIARGINATRISADSEADALLRVAAGEADVALIPETVGQYMIELEGLDLIRLSPPFLPVSYAFAVTPGRPELLEAINTSLTEMLRSGELQQLQQQWLEPSTVITFRTSLQNAAWILVPLSLLTALALFALQKSRDRLTNVKSRLNTQRNLLSATRRKARQDRKKDSLTDMLRREYFLNALADAIPADRSENPFAGVGVIAIKDIKYIQHTAGYEVADGLIKMIAAAVRDHGLESGYLDQGNFAVLLADTKNAEEAEAIMDRLLNTVSCECQINKVAVQASIIGGLALYPKDAKEPAELLRKAELALSNARRRNKNLMRYASSMEPNPRNLTLMADLKRAIDERKLVWAYQPQYSVKEERIIGVELLVRWKHPSHGWIAPDQFIPLAEQTGIIVQLTQEVIRHTILTFRKWRAEGIDCHISINVSANDLADTENVEAILEHSEHYGDLLTVEITETAIMDDFQAIIDGINLLRQNRIKIALDDYGTGYSSLTYLNRFNFDEIKVDKSFIKNLATSDRDLKLTRASIMLGHDIGAKVVAEGVEDLESARILMDLGCDILQGYFISKPLFMDDFVDYLVKSNIPLTRQSQIFNDLNIRH